MAASAMSMGGVPGRGGDDDFSGNDLAGPDQSQAAAPSSKQEQSKGVVAQIKGVHSQLDDLARQFPAGAKELKKAQDSVKEAMVKILSDMQKPSQGGPPVG